MPTKLDEDPGSLGQEHWDNHFALPQQDREDADFKDRDDQVDAPSNPDRHPNDAAKSLSAAEKSGAADNSVSGDQASVQDAEATPSTKHVNNWSRPNEKIMAGDVARGVKNPLGFAQNLIKAGVKNKSPLMLIAGLLVIFSFGSLIGPSALLVNLKENLVANWDQQSISADVRTEKLLAKRLTGETTTGCSALTKFLCRYERPSNRLLQSLDEVGIKAIGKDGKVIEQPSKVADLFNAGERPKAYQLPNGTTFDAKNIATALEKDPVVRNAFRQGYNPRWANWVDKVAIDFLSKLKIPKNTPDKLKNAKNADEAATALSDISKASDDLAADGGSAVKSLTQDEVSRLAEKSGPKVAKAVKKVSSISGTVIATAQMTCIAGQVPGAVVKIRYAYMLAQMAQVAYQFLIEADKIKKQDATPESVTPLATLATQTYTKSDGTKLNSMMDAGELKYGLLNDPAAALSSPYRKNPMYNPGAIGGALGGVLAVTGDPKVKTSCAAINSSAGDAAALAAQATEMAAKGAVPVIGWIALGLQFIGTIALSTPRAQAIISNAATDLIKIVGNLIDWNALLKTLVGDVMKDKQGEELGALVGTGIALTFADLANHGGNAPLTKTQAAKYKTAVATPVKLAWAQEDRLTHSPLDASNPNTFLGSIVTQFIPYQSQMASIPGTLSSLIKLGSSSFHSLLSLPQVKAAASYEGYDSCQPEVNPIIASSDIAAGPLCDTQFGIPEEYINLDPETIANDLHAAKQIDDNGQIVDGSDLATWKTDCLAADMLSYNGCTITDKTSAEYSLYVVDSRLIDSMDNDPPTTADSNTTTVGAASCSAANTAPPDDYTRQSYKNKPFDVRTITMLKTAEDCAKQAGLTKELVYAQGSYSGGAVAASGTSHNGGGAADVSVNNLTGSEINLVVKALREAGFAAWYRDQSEGFSPHIHAMAIGATGAGALGSPAQIDNYFAGLNGLSSNLPDRHLNTIGRPIPTWAEKYGSRYTPGASP